MPRPPEKFLPPHALSLLRIFSAHIEKPFDEIERTLAEGLVKPYWDPALRSCRAARRDLLMLLAKRRLVSFRRGIKGRAALFFVKKKPDADGTEWIRMVVDARQAGACHLDPPPIALGSARAMSRVSLNPTVLRDLGGFVSQPEPCGGDTDVDDSFYNFSTPTLASWFGLDDGFFGCDAIACGIHEIWDDTLMSYVRVQPSEPLWAVFEALCMGWSWSLYFCQSAFEYQASLLNPRGAMGMFREHQPAPIIKPGAPASGLYVDNFNVLGGSRDDVSKSIENFTDALAQHGIGTHGHHYCTFELESLGFVIDFTSGKMHHTSRRTWRFYLATCAIRRRSDMTAGDMQVWLGNAVCMGGLNPELLAILHLSYAFVQAHL
jgi:hypothetical protein